MNNEINNLATNLNYLTKANYVSGKIIEYDIKSANITMLRKYGKITQEYYDYLARLPKQHREVEVGLLIRKDKSYYDTIQFGIIEAKKQLLALNNIQPASVVRIANDAVYINAPYSLQYTTFDDVVFKEKSINNVFMNLGNNILVFVSFIGNEIDIDIKGISKANQVLHQEYMISFIANVIYMIERVSVNDALTMVTEFYKNYVDRKLPIGYYRNLDAESMYRVSGSNFYISNSVELDKIDIGCNLRILRELWSIVLSLCNLRKGQ